MLTFEEFQATKVWRDDLRTVFGWEEYQIGAGYVYAECFVIEKHEDHWQLTVENTSKITDLPTAERELYDYAVTCGGLRQRRAK